MYRIKIRVISRLHPLQMLQPCYLFIYFFGSCELYEIATKTWRMLFDILRFPPFVHVSNHQNIKTSAKLNYNSYCYHRERKWGNEGITLLKRNKQFTY